jgi:hypothetical protein
MTDHQLSEADHSFLEDFTLGRVTPAQFDHRAHVRLAYVLLAEAGVEPAAARMRAELLAFITRNGVDPAKYHETITRGWILAVRHFMDRTNQSASADEFIDANPILLDTKIMLTHYSAALLFSPEARSAFVEPDIQPIPRPL